jgi:ABC-type polysaccharide/polyol phosphate transport system ATPase subunit
VTPAVIFDRVSKKFRRGERHDSLRDLLPALAKRLGGRRKATPTESVNDFWALKDVSFQVVPGQALGIIGPNGAGKSTTLKLLTKILRADRGRSEVRGRVGALIEVAAGFHPDLTGRENIFLQGAIMGMRRWEIIHRLDAIIEFAGVSEFIDTPVKRYSSGMNARLGFSIAAHLDPDVLIIDEVLSVGDMAFQQRCIKRMDEFRKSGIALVFVSHDMAAVGRLCDQTLYLERTVKALGPTPSVIGTYLKQVGAIGDESLCEDIKIERATFAGSESGHATIEPGERVTLRVECVVRRVLTDVTFGLVLYRSTDMLVLYDGNFTPAELGLPPFSLGMRFEVDFDLRPALTRGQYHFQFHVYDNPRQLFVAKQMPAGVLTVQENRTWAGIVDLDARAVAQVSSSESPGARKAYAQSVRVGEA